MCIVIDYNTVQQSPSWISHPVFNSSSLTYVPNLQSYQNVISYDIFHILTCILVVSYYFLTYWGIETRSYLDAMVDQLAYNVTKVFIVSWEKETKLIKSQTAVNICSKWANIHLYLHYYSYIDNGGRICMRYICYLPGGRSVWEKTVLKTKGTVFPIRTDLVR